MEPSRKKRIAILTVGSAAWLADLPEALMDYLNSEAEVIKITTLTEVHQLHSSEPEKRPDAVLVSGPSVALPACRQIVNRLISYTRTGGYTIFVNGPASHLWREEMDLLFRRFCVPWRIARYLHSAYHANPYLSLASELASKIPSHLHTRAMLLTNVDVAQAVYSNIQALRDETRLHQESSCHASAKLYTYVEAPVVLTQYFRGRLAWVGFMSDVDEKEARTLVILGLLRLA